MLENDPQANLNREVPVTPTKPKPKQDFQNILAKMLPDLKVECFKVIFNTVKIDLNRKIRKVLFWPLKTAENP